MEYRQKISGKFSYDDKKGGKASISGQIDENGNRKLNGTLKYDGNFVNANANSTILYKIDGDISEKHEGKLSVSPNFPIANPSLTGRLGGGYKDESLYNDDKDYVEYKNEFDLTTKVNIKGKTRKVGVVHENTTNYNGVTTRDTQVYLPLSKQANVRSKITEDEKTIHLFMKWKQVLA